MHGSAVLGVLAVALLVWGWQESRWLSREPYNYGACRKRGFDQEFCTVTPVNALPNPPCTCEDGHTGRYVVDNGATCVCR